MRIVRLPELLVRSFCSSCPTPWVGALAAAALLHCGAEAPSDTDTEALAQYSGPPLGLMPVDPSGGAAMPTDSLPSGTEATDQAAGEPSQPMPAAAASEAPSGAIDSQTSMDNDSVGLSGEQPGSSMEPSSPTDTDNPGDQETAPDAAVPDDGGYLPPANLVGGASASFVCPPNTNFGDPLAGITEADVQSFGAPPGDFFAFLEGPVWVASTGALYFSDNARGPERIYQLVPPSETTSLFQGEAGSNGLAIDGNDQLILADQRDNRITRMDPNTGEVTAVLVPSGNVRPNDLILRSDGHLYYTDPSSGLYHSTPDGVVSGPVNSGNSPAPLNSANGVVLSPNERLLYAGSVNNNTVSVFDVLASGQIDAESGRLFVTTTGGVVDGMAIDCAGNVYVGTANSVEVYASSGDLLGTVPTGYSSNCTFGGPDRQTLYVTSQGSLKAVRLNVPGLPN